MITKPCEWCGRSFATRHTGERGGPRIARFCSRTCEGARRRLNRAAACAQCGASFRPKYGPARRLTTFCSQSCNGQAHGAVRNDQGRRRTRTRSEELAFNATNAKERYWREYMAAGTANEYIRIRELPPEFQEVARLINETRRELSHRRRAT